MLNNQTIVLKDGRKLGYAEYGDPKGKPLIYFHGWPVSRLSGKSWDKAAKKLEIRFISPDRPGIGLSDFKENRKLIDWADDVCELADRLKIKKFSVLGQSGGGPYAAVCAYKIPERLCNIGILVGLAPTYIPGLLEGMTLRAKLGWKYYSAIPFWAEFGAFSHYVLTKLLLDFLIPWSFGAKVDAKILADKDIRKRMMETKTEAFRQGIRGPALELKLYTSNWGFDLGEIKSKVNLFYGEEDMSVPIVMGKYYQKIIKNSVLKTYPKEGHLISVSHSEEILKVLMM